MPAARNRERKRSAKRRGSVSGFFVDFAVCTVRWIDADKKEIVPLSRLLGDCLFRFGASPPGDNIDPGMACVDFPALDLSGSGGLLDDRFDLGTFPAGEFGGLKCAQRQHRAP